MYQVAENRYETMKYKKKRKERCVAAEDLFGIVAEFWAGKTL